ncbi:hypothetical protein GCM10011504_51730 [Siccirubricoccus deserti]|uniref:Uncharacterized protein n=1 Tax=Siccirubricoccus deserti TaxID=2013562 RepID=A0A9X0R309_9PROT|nr:hypothetical protein [Siccirubricoccus deserti]MBC4018646.1 hypothetical protein [Siccirubricoccus deserti]GGC67426.1 hypothetical protein GCM10011504_51730 [Siccirubricoccus deserti]
MPKADSGSNRSKSEEPGESVDVLRSQIFEILRSSPPGVMTRYIIHRMAGAEEGAKMERVVIQALDAMKTDGLIYSQGSDHESPKWFLSENSKSETGPSSPSDGGILGTTGPH